MIVITAMFAGAAIFVFGVLTGASIMLSIHHAKNEAED